MMCVPMLCMCVSGGAEVGGVTSSDVQQTETQPEEKTAKDEPVTNAVAIPTPNPPHSVRCSLERVSTPLI